MKKEHAQKSKLKTRKLVRLKPPSETVPAADVPIDEETLAAEQFEVAGREDEAASTGHRVEPIINDEEGNAEKLIEEGLHGYLHRSKKNSR